MTDTKGQRKIAAHVLTGDTYYLRCRNPNCYKTCAASGHGLFLGFQCSCGWVNNVDTSDIPGGDNDAA